jgi:predicted  nucleic acid-binding Zn-ribbon protein
MKTKQGNSQRATAIRFEETVLANLTEIKTSLHDLDECAQRLEAKAYDTKPIWENTLKEIAETRIEMRTELRKTGRKIDALNGTLLDVRAEMADFDNRLLRLEPETVN